MTIERIDVYAALARQDALVRRLAPFRSAPPPDTLRCPEHLAFNSEAAPACLAWASAGRPSVASVPALKRSVSA